MMHTIFCNLTSHIAVVNTTVEILLQDITLYYKLLQQIMLRYTEHSSTGAKNMHTRWYAWTAILCQ